MKHKKQQRRSSSTLRFDCHSASHNSRHVGGEFRKRQHWRFYDINRKTPGPRKLHYSGLPVKKEVFGEHVRRAEAWKKGNHSKLHHKESGRRENV